MPPVVALLGGKALIAALGIVLNLNLAWVTYKNRQVKRVQGQVLPAKWNACT